MKTTEKKRIRLRIFFIGFIFSIFFVIIGAKAVYLQVLCGPWLSQKAAGQYEKSFIFQGKRGTIYDTNRREMAVSIDVTSIAAYPSRIKDPQAVAKSLAQALKIDAPKLSRKLASKSSFVWIKRYVTPKDLKAVKNFGFYGMDYIPEHSRYYPNKTLAAHLLGFSGTDSRGLEGIEFYYNSYLQGDSCKVTVLKDALGRGFDSEKKIVADHEGNDLILTIDRTVQYIAENALKEAVVKYSAKYGSVIVMNPATGAVLAMAQYPFFNPNLFGLSGREVWRNRAITDQFEPGSTMKIFNAAAAIESGVCTKNTIFFCENGSYRIGKNIVHDIKSHGWLSLQQIVKYSSNIGAVKVGELTGSRSLYNALIQFGFGEKAGIDFPGETAGSLMPYYRWSKIDAGAISFGQGISVSAIQLLTATCAIANDGVLMKPHIVRAITDHNGCPVKILRPQKIRRAVSARTAGIVKKMMMSVISEGGTGVNAALKGYTVCGKTGTAQKINEQGIYSKGKYISSFIGFAPAEKPEVAILVIIDEPREKHYGGTVAAPAFRKIAYETLNYMNISPVKGTDRLTASLVNGVSW